MVPAKTVELERAINLHFSKRSRSSGHFALHSTYLLSLIPEPGGRLASGPDILERLRGARMIIALYIVAAVIMAVGSLYFAWHNRDFRKFLAGAFFVSSGILFYLYLADVSVPLLGTSFVETPQISGGRSIVHFILFLLCLYFGFVRKLEA
jgi:hypothetical protein